MGLDIYAGTLTRYYTHNWKTVTQQFVEANGMSFQTIRLTMLPHIIPIKRIGMR